MGALCSREQAEDEGAAVTGPEKSKPEAYIIPETSSNGSAPVSKEHPAVAAWRNNSFAVGLSGAGFLMPYHIGALEMLVEQGVVDRSTHMAGASAGSLVITSYKCGLSFDDQMSHFLEVAHNCRKLGVHKRLRPLLKAQLIKYLPDNAHELVNGTLHIAISRPVPRPRNKMFCSFHDGTDLRKALLASCHLPLLSDGWMFTRFRGKRAFDGGLTNAVPVVPGAEYTARVSALPGHCQSEYPAMLNFPKREELAAAPGLFSPWDFTMQQTNNKAFFPQEDAFLHDMRRQGREDMTKWLESVGFPAALATGCNTQATKTGAAHVTAAMQLLPTDGSSSLAEGDDEQMELEGSGGSGAAADVEAAQEEAAAAAAVAAAGGPVLQRCDTRQAAEQLEQERRLGVVEPVVGAAEAAAMEAATAAVGKAGQQDVLRRSLQATVQAAA